MFCRVLAAATDSSITVLYEVFNLFEFLKKEITLALATYKVTLIRHNIYKTHLN